jgi:hypothetical protein
VAGAAARPEAVGFIPTATSRAAWRGHRVVITADRRETRTDRIVLAGHAVVQSLVATQPYVVTINGLTQTLTGSVEAKSAEVLLPDEVILLSR